MADSPTLHWPGPPSLSNDEWLEWCDEYRTTIATPAQFLVAALDPARVPCAVPFRWLEHTPGNDNATANHEVTEFFRGVAQSLHRREQPEETARVAEEPFALD